MEAGKGEIQVHLPEVAQQRPPVEVLASWLSRVDEYGTGISLQQLTDKEVSHPLDQSRAHPFLNQEINIQLAVVVLDVLKNTSYFSEGTAEGLIAGIERGLSNSAGDWGHARSPEKAFAILEEKQQEFLAKGESWQFGKVGLEVSPAAQRAAYKVHAIQELLTPFATKEASEYEDKIADILTVAILDHDQFQNLRSLFGPDRFSVRWVDFLANGGNPLPHTWIEDVLRRQFPAEREDFRNILLNIALAESTVTHGTIMQILKKKSFRNEHGNTPLRADKVADPHFHENKAELYLPLMGPGQLKIQYQGSGVVHTYMPDPNSANIDLALLGAKMVDGVPAVFYDGKVYVAEGRFVNVPVGGGKFVQFVVIRPGDIHDFENIGISPAPAYALTLGFPKEEGLSLENDFYEQPFKRE